MSDDLKRARTQEQKYFRRQQILDAAEGHFREVGYEAFSMAHLARLAGVVKGTLYLYFKTREEVFLSLYNQSLVRWSQVFLESLRLDMSDRDYAESVVVRVPVCGCVLLGRGRAVVLMRRVACGVNNHMLNKCVLLGRGRACMCIRPAQCRGRTCCLRRQIRIHRK